MNLEPHIIELIIQTISWFGLIALIPIAINWLTFSSFFWITFTAYLVANVRSRVMLPNHQPFDSGLIKATIAILFLNIFLPARQIANYDYSFHYHHHIVSQKREPIWLTITFLSGTLETFHYFTILLPMVGNYQIIFLMVSLVLSTQVYRFYSNHSSDTEKSAKLLPKNTAPKQLTLLLALMISVMLITQVSMLFMLNSCLVTIFCHLLLQPHEQQVEKPEGQNPELSYLNPYHILKALQKSIYVGSTISSTFFITNFLLACLTPYSLEILFFSHQPIILLIACVTIVLSGIVGMTFYQELPDFKQNLDCKISHTRSPPKITQYQSTPQNTNDHDQQLGQPSPDKPVLK